MVILMFPLFTKKENTMVTVGDNGEKEIGSS
jgi:hypothetical protein